jgi:hypothetical protein
MVLRRLSAERAELSNEMALLVAPSSCGKASMSTRASQSGIHSRRELIMNSRVRRGRVIKRL